MALVWFRTRNQKAWRKAVKSLVKSHQSKCSMLERTTGTTGSPLCLPRRSQGRQKEAGHKEKGDTRKKLPLLVGRPQLPSPVGRPQLPSPIGRPQLPSSVGRPQLPSPIGRPQLPSSVGRPQLPSPVGRPQLPSSVGRPQPLCRGAGNTAHRENARRETGTFIDTVAFCHYLFLPPIRAPAREIYGKLAIQSEGSTQSEGGGSHAPPEHMHDL